MLTSSRSQIIREGGKIVESCSVIAHLDVACSLARVARTMDYVRPTLERGHSVVSIVDGRHPVVESAMLERVPQGSFVANSCELDEATRIVFLTGVRLCSADGSSLGVC